MFLSMPSQKELEKLLAVPNAASPDAPLAEVLSLMNASGATEPERSDRSLAIENQGQGNCVLIVEEEQLVGTFVEKDLLRVAIAQFDLETTVVREVMTRDPITIDTSQLEDVFTVLNLFRQQDICYLPVTDELNQIVGLATPAFIDRVLQPANFLQLRTVAEAMERKTLRVSPAASVLEVLRLMAENRVCCATIATTPVTVFTPKELLHCLSLGLDLAETAVEEVAIAPVSLPPRTSLWEANQLLLQHKDPCLLVTAAGGEIIGTIAATNILKTINPAAMYGTIRLLQGKVSELEIEKLHVLEKQKIELESQVQQRTRELQQQARCDRLLAEISAGIRLSLDLEEILKTTVSQVRQFLQCDRVFIYRLDSDWNGVAIAEDTKEGIKPLIGKRSHDPCFAPTWVEAYQNGRVRAVNDIYTSHMAPCHIELLESLQIRAKILVPILLATEAEDGSSSNSLWGFISANEAETPREWDSMEVRLLQKLATQVAIAIQQSNLYQKSQWEALVRKKAESVLTQERN
ncbi:MAG: GAF domain-containing protein, partial [Okeania sp. SIO2H7]|nr:GAF domain-containing protein [Okeania sp. SIO2H7]